MKPGSTASTIRAGSLRSSAPPAEEEPVVDRPEQQHDSLSEDQIWAVNAAVEAGQTELAYELAEGYFTASQQQWRSGAAAPPPARA